MVSSSYYFSRGESVRGSVFVVLYCVITSRSVRVLSLSLLGQGSFPQKKNSEVEDETSANVQSSGISAREYRITDVARSRNRFRSTKKKETPQKALVNH